MTQLQFKFDYESLNFETRVVIQEQARELKERLQRSAQDIWEIGQKLAQVRSHLKQRGQFESWLKAEFDLSRRTAYNFINVYESFRESANFAQSNIATSALYLLASPSTPLAIRNQFIQQASTGAKITYQDIREAVSKEKLKRSPVSSQLEPKMPATTRNSPGAITAKLTVTEALQKQTLQTATTINSNCDRQPYWYLLEGKHLLFWGDTNSQEFTVRLPFAAMALAVADCKCDSAWPLDRAKSTLFLHPQTILEQTLVERIISIFSQPGEAIVFPRLPSGEIIAGVHKLGRLLYSGHSNLDRCRQAIATSGLTAEKVVLP